MNQNASLTTARAPRARGFYFWRRAPWCRAIAMLLIASILDAATAEEFVVGARNIGVPFYSTNSPRPAAVLRAGRAFEDYQRSGFFRIGVLPVLALEDITLEVRDPAQLPLTLQRATSRLETRADMRRVLEGRRFAITFPADTNVWLRARRMRLENPTLWRLDEVTIARPLLPPLSLRRALLHTSGAAAGELTAKTADGPVSIQLSDLIFTSSQSLTSP